MAFSYGGVVWSKWVLRHEERKLDMVSLPEHPNAPREILFLLPTLGAGGAERVILTLLNHLDRNRYKVSLAVVDLRNEVFLSEVPSHVELIDLKAKRVLFALPRVIRLIWSMRPNVVFSALSHLNLALAIVRPLLPKGTLCYARESSIVSCVNSNYRNRWLWDWAYRRFYGCLDLVVCQSRAMLDDLIRHYAFPESKATIINNPIDVERARALAGAAPASLSDGKLRLLSVGRFSFEKGYDLAIEALALCRPRDIEWTILGEGPLRSGVEELARNRGVDGQVIFGGFQANPFPYFRRAHALVISSRFEGFPNVALEALACGLPVICTPARGVSEAMGGVPGCLLAREISAEALAEEIIRFTPGQRVGREGLQPYELETIVKRYEHVLG